MSSTEDLGTMILFLQLEVCRTNNGVFVNSETIMGVIWL